MRASSAVGRPAADCASTSASSRALTRPPCLGWLLCSFASRFCIFGFNISRRPLRVSAAARTLSPCGPPDSAGSQTVPSADIVIGVQLGIVSLWRMFLECLDLLSPCAIWIPSGIDLFGRQSLRRTGWSLRCFLPRGSARGVEGIVNLTVPTYYDSFASKSSLRAFVTPGAAEGLRRGAFRSAYTAPHPSSRQIWGSCSELLCNFCLRSKRSGSSVICGKAAFRHGINQSLLAWPRNFDHFTSFNTILAGS